MDIGRFFFFSISEYPVLSFILFFLKGLVVVIVQKNIAGLDWSLVCGGMEKNKIRFPFPELPML